MAELAAEEDGMDALLGSLKQLGSNDIATASGLTNVAGVQSAPSNPYIEITEQPKMRDHRFRYPVEGRQAGSIMGEASNQEYPSYPSIKVHNLPGRAKVTVSLITRDDNPARPHPHRLVGDNCRDGVASMFVDPQHPQAIFRKIGVQRTMNKEVENSLAERERAGIRLQMGVSKGRTGKKHNYDMKCVRLFFEVSLETKENSGIFDHYLEPAVSNPVYDKKDTVLTICRVNIRSGTVCGGDELFILCEKVQSEDIKVQFQGTDPDTGRPWKTYGIFGPNDVHRQFAIVCKTPAFVNQKIKAAVTVTFKLYRPSDEESSNEIEFTYKPRENVLGTADIDNKKRKLDDRKYDRFFTETGNPVKTETLGASSQSCSGNPISTPVSNASSMPAYAPPTASPPGPTHTSAAKDSLRQRLLMRTMDTSPSTSTGAAYAVGTSQPTNATTPATTTYPSGADMSSGRLIQQHQPVSSDQGQFGLGTSGQQADSLSQSILMTQATGQYSMEASGGDDDDERQNSEQMINCIAEQLKLSSSFYGENQFITLEGGNVALPVAGNANVLVQQEPSAALADIQYSFNTVDETTLQELMSHSVFDITYSQQGEMEIETSTNRDANPT